MAGGWNVKTGNEARKAEAACGCGSPGFSHYRSLHPGRDQSAAGSHHVSESERPGQDDEE